MEQKVTNQIQMGSSVTKPQVDPNIQNTKEKEEEAKKIIEQIKKEKEELQKKLQEEAAKAEAKRVAELYKKEKEEAAKAEFYNPKLGEPHKTKVWKVGMEVYAKGEKVKILKFMKDTGRYLVETSKGVKKVFDPNELSANSD